MPRDLALMLAAVSFRCWAASATLNGDFTRNRFGGALSNADLRCMTAHHQTGGDNQRCLGGDRRMYK